MAEYEILKKRKTKLRTAGKVVSRFFTVLLVTVLIAVTALCSAMWVLVRGPSPAAKKLSVMTARETSAMGWLPNLYLTNYEIDLIMRPAAAASPEDDVETTDTTLITIAKPKPVMPVHNDTVDDSQPNVIQETDEYEDIEFHKIFGNGYRGFMLVVKDPKRLFVGTPRSFGGTGVLLENMVRNTGAVAGINAGGFYDPQGTGRGGIPDGIVICDGVLRWGADVGSVSLMGFDDEGILHVGNMDAEAAMELNLQWAVSFGPVLIKNGVVQKSAMGRSGINPRTAIGQRADGAALLLVIDGRQIDSLGATYDDLVDIFLDYGAINAANLDGGSSTLMVYNGEVINRSASVSGPRPLPTAFLVRAADG